jgi:glycosyltransferase involved in cell wall biosynthesis
MKILWVSNAPFIGSGYGVQTHLFTQLAKQDGHEPVVFGFYGHHGPPMMADGVEILPASYDGYGNDMLAAHIEHYKPDMTVSLIDVWVLPDEFLSSKQVAAWVPIDHNPIPPLVLEKLHQTRQIWAMSRFGEKLMRQAGLKPFYVPHGVDTTVYQPLDRQAARAGWNIREDQFFVVSVAANKGFPSRKNIPQLLKAWGKFVQTHPDAVLYLHTDTTGTHSGLNIGEMAAFYGIPAANLRLPDMYRYMRSEYSAVMLNKLYNAADVFVLPSAGEGFGVPVIEAQAAGCPVIVTDFTAQSELCGSGWLISVDPFDDLGYTLQKSEQANVRPSLIVEALEQAFAARGDQSLRDKARKFALQYDARKVWETYMLPALKAESELEAARDARTAIRLAARQQQKHPAQFKTPVVMTVYNRPDHTRQVLERIAMVRPEKLLVVADGAKDNDADRERVAAVRAQFEALSWDCELVKIYADHNMGPGDRGYTGYTEVFQRVERAIILEDDCLPEETFFRFCEELLEKYADDPLVTMISGFNYARTLPIETSYMFSKYAASWGWATWRRVWQHYDHEMKFWNDEARQNLVGDPEELAYMTQAFDTAIQCGPQTWDTRWWAARTVYGMGIVPKQNLISNIGYGKEATHAHDESSIHNQTQTWAMDFPLVHPVGYTHSVDCEKALFDAMVERV